MIEQFEIKLPNFRRGIHLITHHIESQLKNLPQKGLLNIFIQHTSAGLTINENADPAVRTDLEKYFDKFVPENEPYFDHTLEGSDDMPAHIKSTLTGSSLTIPVSNGRLNLGTWQGIYLCEFRNHGGSRRLMITIFA
ncbi:MAG: secondary thiamine-phosphate synthase enzyme YjbQ [Bacteroidales bacterium]|nr:secondary thiamine-phosphate synthase enzyme YjbQ [Bacteroidales bacterium]